MNLQVNLPNSFLLAIFALLSHMSEREMKDLFGFANSIDMHMDKKVSDFVFSTAFAGKYLVNTT